MADFSGEIVRVVHGTVIRGVQVELLTRGGKMLLIPALKLKIYRGWFMAVGLRIE